MVATVSPILGLSVLYMLSVDDVLEIANNPEAGEVPTAGYILPAVIVKAHEGNPVNLQVFTDGIITLWRQNVIFGVKPGCWFGNPGTLHSSMQGDILNALHRESGD